MGKHVCEKHHLAFEGRCPDCEAAWAELKGRIPSIQTEEESDPEWCKGLTQWYLPEGVLACIELVAVVRSADARRSWWVYRRDGSYCAVESGENHHTRVLCDWGSTYDDCAAHVALSIHMYDSGKEDGWLYASTGMDIKMPDSGRVEVKGGYVRFDIEELGFIMVSAMYTWPLGAFAGRLVRVTGTGRFRLVPEKESDG